MRDTLLQCSQLGYRQRRERSKMPLTESVRQAITIVAIFTIFVYQRARDQEFERMLDDLGRNTRGK